MLGFIRSVNAIGNPRVQTLHGSDVVALLGAGWCLGFEFVLLLSKPMFGKSNCVTILNPDRCGDVTAEKW